MGTQVCFNFLARAHDTMFMSASHQALAAPCCERSFLWHGTASLLRGITAAALQSCWFFSSRL